jgi:hypothetical protein
MVKGMVPKGWLLECRFGEGWGPLCGFLDGLVPGVPFSRVDEEKCLRELLRIGMSIIVVKVMWVVLRYPYCCGSSVVVSGQRWRVCLEELRLELVVFFHGRMG